MGADKRLSCHNVGVWLFNWTLVANLLMAT